MHSLHKLVEAFLHIFLFLLFGTYILLFAYDTYREKVGVLHHLAEGRIAGEKLDDGIGVEEITLTIHRGCASGKPLDPLAVSDAPPPARSRNGAALLRRPRQARRLSGGSAKPRRAGHL